MDKNKDQTNASTKDLDSKESLIVKKNTDSNAENKEQARLEQELDATLDQAAILLEAEPSTISNKNNQNKKDE